MHFWDILIRAYGVGLCVIYYCIDIYSVDQVYLNCPFGQNALLSILGYSSIASDIGKLIWTLPSDLISFYSFYSFLCRYCSTEMESLQSPTHTRLCS